MKDSELFELVNFFPNDDTWTQVFHRRNLWGQINSNQPKSHWLQWAKDFLMESPKGGDGVEVVLRLLTLAEMLYPGGMERHHLEGALGYLSSVLKVNLYPGACIDWALQQNVIREDPVDMWIPGMRSGTGWRTFYRLSLLGKTKVDISDMPPMYEEPKVPYVPKAQRPKAPPRCPTETTRAGYNSAALGETRPKSAVGPGKGDLSNQFGSAGIEDDFVWSKPFVEQHVRLFFKHHSKDYCQMVVDVLNNKKEMTEFVVAFGPSKISRWINERLCVRASHPNPCKPQNVNASATYNFYVKTFKNNPNNHDIAKKLDMGESLEVKEILNGFWSNEDSEE